MVLDRDLVVVSGPDTWTFLQSLVSQDVEGLEDGMVVHSLLLTPQGKLAFDFRLLRRGDDAWFDVEAGHGAGLAAALERFRIRVKAEVHDRSAGWGMIAIRGTGEPPRATDALAVIPVVWGDQLGVDLVGPHDALANLDLTGQPVLDAGAYERARIVAGVPRLGAELDASVIPQEAFLERNAVSFTKGCFIGQELVCRIDSRGHVNRFLRQLRFDDADFAPVPGASIRHGERVVGTVTSVAPGVALGYVRREVEPPADVVVDGPDGSGAGGSGQARVEALSGG